MATSSSTQSAAATIEATIERNSYNNIPLDVMAEILCRLPMKSLARFQCVCRQWRSLTHEHYFLHEKLLGRRRQRVPILIQKSNTEKKIDVYHDIHDQRTGTRRSGNYYYYSIPTEEDDGESEYTLSNSVHGLVACARESPTHKLFYYLLNPIHQDLFVKLPDPTALRAPEKNYLGEFPDGVGLGFDDSTGEYKVVRPIYRDRGKHSGIVFDILTLGGGGGRGYNWRCVAQQLPPNISFDQSSIPVFLHGVLYWHGHVYEPYDEHVIVTLDIKEEKLGPLIPFPSYVWDVWDVAESLYEFRGHVCLVLMHCEELRMRIWMLEEDHKWTRLCCFRKRYAPFLGALGTFGNIRVLGITDERILFMERATDDEDATICTWQLFAYHLDKKKLEWLQCPLYSDYLEIHQETFLSPREFSL